MVDTEIQYHDIDKVCRGCLGKKGEMRPLYGSCLDIMLMTVAEIQVSTSINNLYDFCLFIRARTPRRSMSVTVCPN